MNGRTVPLLVSLLLIAFVAATNPWLSWNDAIEYAQSHDVRNYEAIARAAPALPDPSAAITHHHAQRFVAPWLAGSVSKVLGLSVPGGMRLVACLLLVGLVTVCLACVRAAGLGGPAGSLAAGLVICNPYLLRYYMLTPGMLCDVLFHLGAAMLVLGILRERVGWTVAGLAAAALGRQTAILLLPGFVLWVIWRMIRERTRTGRIPAGHGIAALAILLAPILYVVTWRIARGFSSEPISASLMFGLFPALAGGTFGPGGVGELGLRIVLPFFPSLALVAAAAVSPGRIRLALPEVVLFVLAAAVCAQPLLMGPLTGKNAGRLAALGLVPFAMAAARFVADRTRGGASPFRRGDVVPVALLALLSLHHLYSVIGPWNVEVYVVAQAGLSLALGVAATFRFRVMSA